MRKLVKNLYRFGAVILGAGLTVGFLAGTASATPLLVGNSVTVGGVTFTVSACALDTVACTVATGDFSAWAGHGKSIIITGPTGGSLLNGTGTTHDLSVLFTATALSPFMRNVEATMRASGANLAIVSEVITSNPALVNDNLQLVYFKPGNFSLLQQKTPDFPAQKELDLDKDIFVDDAIIDYVTESVNVPEPSGLSLLLVGCAAMFRARRRAKQARA